MVDITVYRARKVITMDPGRPFAECVAVRDGRIVSTGTIESMQPWLKRYSHTIDETFADKIIMPGFIDPHTHFALSSSYLIPPGRKGSTRACARGPKSWPNCKKPPIRTPIRMRRSSCGAWIQRPRVATFIVTSWTPSRPSDRYG